MTVQKWLSDVYYDDWGTHIFNRETADGGSQLIADVRGWGRLQNEFKTKEEAANFQDEVGRFIAAAIREKITRDTADPEITDYRISPFGTPEAK